MLFGGMRFSQMLNLPHLSNVLYIYPHMAFVQVFDKPRDRPMFFVLQSSVSASFFPLHQIHSDTRMLYCG